MFEYKYTREILEGNGYNINNPARKDPAGNQLFLAKEVSDYWSDKVFILQCANEEACFIFELELTNNEKNILDTLVYNHKNNL